MRREYGTVAFINLVSSQSDIHTRAPTSYNHQTVVVKYTCFTKICIHYFKPLSDGSKRPNERTGTHGHHIHRVVPVHFGPSSRIQAQTSLIHISIQRSSDSAAVQQSTLCRASMDHTVNSSPAKGQRYSSSGTSPPCIASQHRARTRTSESITQNDPSSRRSHYQLNQTASTRPSPHPRQRR